MSDVTMLLDGVPLTVAPDGTITGEHEVVHVANVKVARTVYSPNRQQTAVSLLQRFGRRAGAARAAWSCLHARPTTIHWCGTREAYV